MALPLSFLLDADWNRLNQLSAMPARKRRWSAHFSPRFLPVVLIRLAGACHGAGWRRTAKFWSFVNFVLFGIEVPARLEIGPGLVLPHTQGTVLGAAAIGSNVTIFHQVTLGAREADFGYDPATRPTISDHVTLSVGAKVLGPVHIASNVVVAANAVVLSDVPAGSLAAGVPAVVRPRSGPDVASA
ncbi:serine O-acetyltransferase [Parapedomonas caeni]